MASIDPPPTGPIGRAAGRVRRLISALAVAAGLAPAAAATAEPRSVAPHAAPQAWLDYAVLVSQQVQARVSGDDPIAKRLRDDISQLPGADLPDGVTLRLAFWIDAAGAITRVDGPLFAQTGPSDDLKTLMVGYTLPKPPPQGMLLPLRLAIQIKPDTQAKPQPQAWPHPRQGQLPAITVQASQVFQAISLHRQERGGQV